MQTEDNTHPRLRRPGSWTPVPSQIARDRNYMGCSLAARHMHLIAWLYSNREHTDGKLSTADFRNVAAESQLAEGGAMVAAAELVDAGLWTRDLELVDFLKWNHTAEEIKSRAAENLASVQAFRRDGKKGSPDPSKESRSDRSTEAQVRAPVRNALHDPDETEGQKTVRLAIARLAADKALEFNGQGRLHPVAEDVA